MIKAPHERLRDLRVGKGFETQKRFCSQAMRRGIDIDLRRYRDIESGRVNRPSLEEIRLICVAMGISADDWVGVK